MCFPVFLKMPSPEFTASRGVFFKEQRRRDRPAAIGGLIEPLFSSVNVSPWAEAAKKGLLETLERDAGEIEFRGFEG
ncbi:hypothetical protein J2S34_002572 [Nitrobacter winogradskyi]|uniref:Uncharacterized protein n=1 Tax=Nitrobacter winogradskyi TaxID=913 RepID=A0ACC6AL55_NITWI|nr:hypothetical protein [Nitrobacter winogradskyi]